MYYFTWFLHRNLIILIFRKHSTQHEKNFILTTDGGLSKDLMNPCGNKPTLSYFIYKDLMSLCKFLCPKTSNGKIRD